MVNGEPLGRWPKRKARVKTASKRVGENLFTHKTSEAVSTKSMVNELKIKGHSAECPLSYAMCDY